MNTVSETKIETLIDEKTGQHYTTVGEEGAEYITIAEYIRRRHEEDLEKDKLANPLYDSSIRKVTKRGDIVLYKQGSHFFINWNKYKSWVFLRYRQIPRDKKKIKGGGKA